MIGTGAGHGNTGKHRVRWGLKELLGLCLGLGALAAALPAPAQGLMRPAEFYFDDDRLTTRPFEPLDESQISEGVVRTLLRQPIRDRRAAEALGRVAHTAIASGRVELGRSLYERALSDLGQNHGSTRQLLWNLAWDLQRAGQHEAALERWTELVGSRSSRASWIPPTLALSLWQADRREEALHWYAAAVRTEPGLWTTPGDFAALLPDWRTEDRAVLVRVHAAWAANPPAWP